MHRRETAPYHVLFLGNGNRSTSLLAEAYLNWAGQSRFRAYSAGYGAADFIDPVAVEVLAVHRINPAKCRSKGWDQFVGRHAPTMDFIFLVCPRCPEIAAANWPGQPIVSQWQVSVPSGLPGDVAVKRQAFLHAFAELTARINKLLDVPIGSLDRPTLQATFDGIGEGRI